MENFEHNLENIKNRLLASSKEKILCLSTTANQNNPDIFFGSMRETPTTIAGNIIVRTLDGFERIIEMFDGVVDYFLLDCEIKNEVPNLEAYAVSRIHTSKFLVYKPNDFTVSSLDMLIATLRGSLRGQKVVIIGLGNIGAKIALALCERGANVFVFERRKEKMQTIVAGLNAIKRSDSEIQALVDISEGSRGADILLGCTPGVPVIDKALIGSLHPDALVIDVGNGTVTSDGITAAKEHNMPVYCLSSFGGYLGAIENWLFQRKYAQGAKEKRLGTFTLIVPGILGAYGDILVDSIENMTRVIGLCDGKGDILSEGKAHEWINSIVETDSNKETLQKIKELFL